MAAKESELKTDQGTMRRRQILRYDFWTQALEEFRANDVSRFENISPSKDHWLSCATGVSGCSYSLIFLRKEVRVELLLQRPDTSANKWIFDQLREHKQQFENSFKNKLKWLRLNDKKSSKICYARSSDGDNRENWPEMIEWLCRHFVRLDKTFSGSLASLSDSMKSR